MGIPTFKLEGLTPVSWANSLRPPSSSATATMYGEYLDMLSGAKVTIV